MKFTIRFTTTLLLLFIAQYSFSQVWSDYHFVFGIPLSNDPATHSCPNSSDPECYQQKIPVYLEFDDGGAGRNMLSTILICDIFLEGTVSGAQIVDICQDFTGGSVMTINHSANSFSGVNGGAFSLPVNPTGGRDNPIFILIVEKTPGAGGGGSISAAITQFVYHESTCSGNPLDDIDISDTNGSGFNALPCTSPGIGLTMTVTNQVGQLKQAEIRIQTGGTNDPVEINRLSLQLNLTDTHSNIESFTGLEVTSSFAFSQMSPDYTTNANSDFLFVETENIPMSFSDGDLLFSIPIQGATQPEAGGELLLISTFIDVIKDGECCVGAIGSLGTVTIDGVLPCSAEQDVYDLEISGPEELIEGCLSRYTVSMINPGFSDYINFSSLELDVVFDGDISGLEAQIIPAVCGGCTITPSSNSVQFNSSGIGWTIDPVNDPTPDRFEIMDIIVERNSGSAPAICLNEVAHAKATGDISDIDGTVYTDDDTCVPDANKNTEQVSCSENLFNLSFEQNYVEGCHASFTVFLNYDGDKSNTLALEDAQFVVEVGGDNLTVSADAGCGSSCISVSGQTIDYNPSGGFSFPYTPGSSIELFDIEVEASSSSIEEMIFSTVYWSHPSFTGEVCAPEAKDFFLNIPLEGEVAMGSVKDACGDPIKGIEICMSSGCSGDCLFYTPALPPDPPALPKTGADGKFAIPQLLCAKFDEELTATPLEKDCEPTCGVSTFDLLIISRHILNVELLTNPYLRIAADANCSGHISTLDLTTIRKVILRTQLNFSGCPSTCMRFIDETHEFQTNKPEGEIIPSGSEGCIEATDGEYKFIGVKLGDVNCDAGPECLGIDDMLSNVSFKLPNFPALPNQTVQIPFKASGFPALSALQNGISFNISKLQFNQAIPGALPGMTEGDNFGLTEVEDGRIRTLWFDETGGSIEIEDNTVAYTLEFTTLETITDWSTVIELDDDVLQNLAWASDETVYGFDLNFGEDGGTGGRVSNGNTQLTTGQRFDVNNIVTNLEVKAVPNPFEQTTTLEILLPEANEVTVEIFNSAGSKVKIVEQNLAKGMNTIRLEMFKDMPTGVYTYIVTGGKEQVTGKIVKL